MEKEVQVAIVMGSDSDLPIMKDAAKILDEFGISYEVKVLSVHRTPLKALEYAKSLKQRKVQVIIGGAGGAAHLPGIFAAMVPVPVIGVPIHTKTLSGVDSLYSIVQMPSGIPVATVAINGAKNAGILAATILAASDEEMRLKIENYKKTLAEQVTAKDDKLQDLGYENYLKQM